MVEHSRDDSTNLIMGQAGDYQMSNFNDNESDETLYNPAVNERTGSHERKKKGSLVKALKNPQL